MDITSYPANQTDHPIYWPLRAAEDGLWLFLATGASVDGSSSQGTALHVLTDARQAKQGDHASLIRMLVQSCANREASDVLGLTPVACGASVGALAEAAALLAAGANPNVRFKFGTRGDVRHQRPHLFAVAGNKRIFQLHATNGAETTLCGRSGEALVPYLEKHPVQTEVAHSQCNMSGNLTMIFTRRRNAYVYALGFLAVQTRV